MNGLKQALITIAVQDKIRVETVNDITLETLLP